MLVHALAAVHPVACRASLLGVRGWCHPRGILTFVSASTIWRASTKPHLIAHHVAEEHGQHAHELIGILRHHLVLIGASPPNWFHDISAGVP